MATCGEIIDEIQISEVPVPGQIDPSSCDCLIAASYAIKGGKTYLLTSKTFYSLGGKDRETTAIGVAVHPIIIDEITLSVLIYVVPDATLPIPFIVGRT